MKDTVMVFLVGLALGVGVTKVLSAKGEVEGKSEASSTISTRSQPTEVKEPRAVDIENWQKLNRSEWVEKLNGADHSELQRVIEELVKQGDPFKGLSSNDRRLIESMMGRMANTDFEGTMAWISREFESATRESLIVACLEKSIELNFEQSLEFAKNSLDEGMRDKVVGKFLLQGLKLGAEEALAVLEIMPDRQANFASGSGGDFATGFEFAKFGEGVLALSEARTHKRWITKFPGDFLKVWASREPGETIGFYQKHLKNQEGSPLPLNDLGDLAEGYLGAVDPEESAAWVDEMLDSELPKGDRRDLLSSIQELKNKRVAILEQLVERRSNATGKVKILGEFYDSLSRSGGGELEDFRTEILELFPDPESRMDHVMATVDDNRNAIQRIAEDLEALGHSEEEVTRFREAGKR
ncbi:MAG: hypothetical protein ACJAVK_003501 [Akkermansiaceae bacterium]|jgi:hypothetical protein